MPERIRTNYDIKNNKIWYSNEEIEHKLLYRYVIKYNNASLRVAINQINNAE